MELDPKFLLRKKPVKTYIVEPRYSFLLDLFLISLHLRILCSKISASMNNYREILIHVCAVAQSEVPKNQVSTH